MFQLEHASAIQLSSELVHAGIEGSIAGWGYIAPSLPVDNDSFLKSDHLKQLKVRIIDNEDCITILGYQVHHSEMCAVSAERSSSNFGPVSS